LTNISVGIIVGIFEKKGLLKDLFGFLSTAFVITIVSVAVSTPLNFLLADGNVGNMWGDGMIAFCRTLRLNNTVSCIVGEFYMDFLDKTLTMVLFFLIIHLKNKKADKHSKDKKTIKNIVSAILAVILIPSVFGSSAYISVSAYGTNDTDDDYDKYIRKVYNGDNGLPGGMANDIVQTKDGILWIGTYGGLYRYCGNDIEWMNNIESIKTVNCLYTDEAGRLWIGTNDNGLSIYINDKITNELTKADGFPSNSVRCITEGSNGFYYAGTTDSLVVLTMSGGLKVYDTIEEVVFARRICADKNGNVVAVTDEGSLYLIQGTEVAAKLTADENGESFSSCTFDESGALYVGTSLNTVKKFDISEGTFKELDSVECGELLKINSLTCSDNGTLFLCADNGAGYITAGNEYHSIDVSGFNSSIEHMLIDYQGNLWFTSSRLGLLCLCRSVFTEMNESDGLSGNVVNTVTRWQDTLYFGTDSGLDAVNNNQSIITKQLIEALDGVRIRCLMSDSENNLWICTSGKGVWEVAPNGNIEKYDSSNGALGEKFRSAIELKDGTVAVAGDYGVSFINNGKVIDAIGSSEGLTNPKLLTLCEKTDGSILAGTDGNGIAVIKDGRIVQEIKQEDGLSSDIILRIVKNSDDDGYFIVTGNGLC
ncbi:MAG: HD domain protein, partial [Ruminiclostridium sp.]|nr:HD domain protein [Ruminiclostridium sp.]